MKNRYAIFLSLIGILLMNSCNNSRWNEFLNGNKRDDSTKLIEEGFYIVLPLNSCNTCFNEIYGELKNLPDEEQNDRIGVILVGETKISVNNFGAKILFKNVFYDVENFLSENYNLGNQYPWALRISNYKIEEKIEISTNKLNFGKNIIKGKMN